MKIKALLAMLFSVMLVFGLATIADAQTNPDQKPKSTDKQKDDDRDDDEEDDSPEMQAKLAKEAKISIEQARKTALERVAGTITEEEIEIENGVLVYSIEIRDANGKTHDVEVDAKTGEILFFHNLSSLSKKPDLLLLSNFSLLSRAHRRPKNPAERLL